MQNISILASRYQGGVWKDWEHTCDEREAAAVMDTAYTCAFERNFSSALAYVDYLQGARYIFDVARGPTERPVEGDTRVYGVSVGELVMGRQEDLERHFARSQARGRN